MNGSNNVTKTGTPGNAGGSAGHFSASMCPECNRPKISRKGWQMRRCWLVCASCAASIDAERAARKATA